MGTTSQDALAEDRAGRGETRSEVGNDDPIAQTVDPEQVRRRVDEVLADAIADGVLDDEDRRQIRSDMSGFSQAEAEALMRRLVELANQGEIEPVDGAHLL